MCGLVPQGIVTRHIDSIGEIVCKQKCYVSVPAAGPAAIAARARDALAFALSAATQRLPRTLDEGDGAMATVQALEAPAGDARAALRTHTRDAHERRVVVRRIDPCRSRNPDPLPPVFVRSVVWIAASALSTLN